MSPPALIRALMKVSIIFFDDSKVLSRLFLMKCIKQNNKKNILKKRYSDQLQKHSPCWLFPSPSPAGIHLFLWADTRSCLTPEIQIGHAG